jgi:dihydroorotase
MTLVIRNGRLIDPVHNLDEVGWVHIHDAQIAGVGSGSPPAGLDPDETIDATGLVVCPGFIDLHVHLREPGEESKETIESGSHAAVAGGFTTIVCMPNTKPPIDNLSTVKFINLEAQRVNRANVFPVGAVSRGRAGEELADIGELVGAGVVAISDDGSPVMDAGLMRRAVEYARMFNIPVIDHCEDLQLNSEGVMNEGRYSTILGLRGIPTASEDVMIARDIILADYASGRVHIAHLSTRHGVHMVRDAKQRGVAVTCEVTPHHLTLTDAALCEFDTNFKMNPPLRSENDRLALIEGLVDGTVDAIATDHAPHSSTSKEIEFDYAANGVIGMESALPVLYTQLVCADVIPLMRLVELLTSGPARVLGHGNKGTLAAGADADVTIWDPESRYAIDVNTFKSKSRNCPFDGWEVQGKVVRTIVGGETKYVGAGSR